MKYSHAIRLCVRTFVLSFALFFGANGQAGVATSQAGNSSDLCGTKSPPSDIQIILDPQSRIECRLGAVDSLGDSLTPEEVVRLSAFLEAHPGPLEKNMAGLRCLKNNVLNALRNQTKPPPRLTETMLKIFHDHGQDYVTREYAVQQMISWYEQGALDRLDGKTRIREVLHEALAENDSATGTAILGMHRLSAIDRAFDKTEIDRTALRLATSPATSVAVRITAIQVCAERGETEVLPTVQSLAITPVPTALRLSAIAALGLLGGEEQAALLREPEIAQETALHPAVDAALKRIQRRLPGLALD
jgi:hypothetical protein